MEAVNPNNYTVGEMQLAENREFDARTEAQSETQPAEEKKSILGKLKEKTHSIKDKLTKKKSKKSKSTTTTTAADADKVEGASSSSSSSDEEDAQEEQEEVTNTSESHENVKRETGSSGRQGIVEPMSLLPSPHGHDDKCACCGVQHHDTKLDAGVSPPPPVHTGGPVGQAQQVKSKFEDTPTGLPIGHVNQGSSSNLGEVGHESHQEPEAHKGGISASIASKVHDLEEKLTGKNPDDRELQTAQGESHNKTAPPSSPVPTGGEPGQIDEMKHLFEHTATGLPFGTITEPPASHDNQEVTTTENVQKDMKPELHRQDERLIDVDSNVTDSSQSLLQTGSQQADSSKDDQSTFGKFGEKIAETAEDIKAKFSNNAVPDGSLKSLQSESSYTFDPCEKAGREPQQFEGSRGLPSPQPEEMTALFGGIEQKGLKDEERHRDNVYGESGMRVYGDDTDTNASEQGSSDVNQLHAGNLDALGQQEDKKHHRDNVYGDSGVRVYGEDTDTNVSNMSERGSPLPTHTSAITGTASRDFDITSASGPSASATPTPGEYQSGEPRSSEKEQDRSAEDPTASEHPEESTDKQKGFLARVTDKAKHLLGVGATSDASASTGGEQPEESSGSAPMFTANDPNSSTTSSSEAHKHVKHTDVLGKMVARDLAAGDVKTQY